MAKTLTGIIQLILKDGASGQAKKVEQSLNNVKRSAMGLGGAAAGADRLTASLNKMGNAPWGASLQARLEKLKLMPQEFDRVRDSWNKLQSTLSYGANPKLDARAISTWRTSVLAHFAAVQASANTTRSKLADVMKIGFTAAGLGTGAYVGGRIARASVTSDASIERERFRMRASGLTGDQSAQIEARASALAAKYGDFKGDTMEVLREAVLGLSSLRDRQGNVVTSNFDSAMGLSEAIVQFNKSMQNIHGKEGAADQTRAMMKAIDILGVTDPKVIQNGMDSFVRMNRVIGKDTDPRQLFLAAKYSRASGKALDPDFFFSMLPALMAESSGSDIGTQVRAMFSAVAGGRMSKKSTQEFKKFGLVDKQGQIAGADLMNNPGLWIESVLKPRLEKNGVDTKDPVKLAGILSRLFDNRLSSDLAFKFIDQMEQYRETQQKAKKAHGLEKAGDIRKGDPFAAYDAFLNSLKNLSSALGITEALAAGLNGLADAINGLSRSAEAVRAFIASAGATGKVLSALFAAIAGGGLAYATIKGAALGLGLLGGAIGALSGVAGGAGLAGLAGSIGLVTGALSGLAGLFAPGAVLLGGIGGFAAILTHLDEKLKQDIKNKDPSADKFLENQKIKGDQRISRQDQFVADYLAAGGKLSDLMLNKIQSGDDVKIYQKQIQVESGSLDEAGKKAENLQQKIQEMNVTASPQVDQSSLAAAESMLDRLISKLQQLNSGARNVAPGVGSAYSDFGVSP